MSCPSENAPGYFCLVGLASTVTIIPSAVTTTPDSASPSFSFTSNPEIPQNLGRFEGILRQDHPLHFSKFPTPAASDTYAKTVFGFGETPGLAALDGYKEAA